MQRILGRNWRGQRRTRECGVIDPTKESFRKGGVATTSNDTAEHKFGI